MILPRLQLISFAAVAALLQSAAAADFQLRDFGPIHSPALQQGAFELEARPTPYPNSRREAGEYILSALPRQAPRIQCVAHGPQVVLWWPRDSSYVLEFTDDLAAGWWRSAAGVHSDLERHWVVLTPQARRYFRLVLRQARPSLLAGPAQ